MEENKEINETKETKPSIKLIIILAAILLAALIITLLVVFNYRQYTRLFQDTDYPVAFKEKDGSIVVTVKDKSGNDTVWFASCTDADFVTIEPKGKTSSKKAKYIIKPGNIGVTDITFSKPLNIGGLVINETGIVFHAYVSETTEGNRLEFIGDAELSYGLNILAKDSDHPVILREDAYSEENGLAGNLCFVNGIGDWEVKADNDDIYIYDYEEDGRVYMYLGYAPEATIVTLEEDSEDIEISADPFIGSETDAEIAYSTESDAMADSVTRLTLSSKSIGIDKTYDITFSMDGRVEYSESEK